MTISRALDHPWIRELVPSQSRIFYGDSQGSLGNSQNKATPTTDGALACSQSMEQLQLFDRPIPALGMNRQEDHTASPQDYQLPMDAISEISEVSVTSKMPGAYPKPPKQSKKHPLPPLSEEPDGMAWDIPAKRKSQDFGGSSPLTPLSSEDDVTPSPKRVSPRSAKPRAVSAPPKNPKRTRVPPSGGRARRAAIQEEPANPPSRRTTRGQPAAKVARRH